MNKYVKLLVVVVGATIMLVGVVQLTLAAILNSDPLNVSKTRSDSGYPAIAVSPDGQHIGMVWSDRYPNPTGANPVQGPIYFKSAKDGATLDQRVTVDGAFSQNDQSWLPDIVTDPISPANMHVVWTNVSGGSLSDTFYTIYYARCATINATCGNNNNHEQIRRTTFSPFSEPGSIKQVVRNVRIAASSIGSETYLHVVYEFQDERTIPLQRRIIYQGKKGAGNWTDPQVVSLEGAGDFASHPAVAVTKDGSNNIFVHLVWASDNNIGSPDDITDRIRYRRGRVDSTNGRILEWTDPQLFNFSGATRLDYPAVVGVGSTVMILWDALKGGPDWPSGVNNPETYFAIYTYADNVNVLPIATAPSFSTPAHLFASPTDHVSDNSPNDSNPDTWLQGSEHGRRLQPKVAGEAPLDGGSKFYAVWHETTTGSPYFHDVRLAEFWHGTSSCPGEAECDEWFPATNANNETNGLKLGDPTPVDEPYYSMSPDVAVANGQVYALYMEGKEQGAFDVAETLFDIIYKGTVTLTDTTTNNPTDLGGIYMPIIMKNAS